MSGPAAPRAVPAATGGRSTGRDQLVPEGGQAVRRLDATTVVRPTTVVTTDHVVASAWVAPAVRGTGDPHRLQGVLVGEPVSATDDDRGTGPAAVHDHERLPWTLGLDRSGRPVVRLGLRREGAAAPVEVVGPRALPLLTWSHLAAELRPHSVTLLVDGVAVGSVDSRDGHAVAGPTRVHLGRSLDVVVEGAVRYGFFTGLVADIGVGRPSTTGAPAVDPAEAWATDPSRFDADRDRPRFHFMPPAQWMNEPHGVLHHEGRHHLFYQRNELGPFWGAITWGHAVSDDLVHWTDLGSNLDGADIPYAADGVWSGSATLDADGTPLLFFTAGDFRDEPNQRTAWARPVDAHDRDLRDWQVAPGPVTTLQDALPALRAAGLEPLLREFRDPFVWREGDSWFQLVGAGLEGRGGTALLFRSSSPTSEAWEFCGPLAIGDATARPDTGVMWELPVLLPVGTDGQGRAKHALFVTPWWPEPCEHSLSYQWYWTGQWDPASATWTPDHTEPRLLDLGSYFTGVTGSVTPEGRTLLWTITQDLLSEHEHAARGWAGNAGFPLEVGYADADLRVAPARELDLLRQPAVLELGGRTDGALPDNVPVDAGPMVELQLTAALPAGGFVEVAFRVPLDGEPAARLQVERTGPHAGVVTVVRPAGGRPDRAERRGDVLLPASEDVSLHVLLDHSMVEAFVHNRRSVTTRAWARPGDGDRGYVRVGGGATLRGLVVRPLHSAAVRERRATDSLS